MMDYRRNVRGKPRVVRKLYGSEEDEQRSAWPTTSDSDTSQSDSNARSSPVPVPGPHRGGYCSDSSPCKVLPPIGVFWDIENCQIPRGRSAVAVAQVIRDKFFDGYREAEFLVVCDVKKETSQVIQELNDAQVNLIHVGSHCKNAADDKLRQSIRRFADIHGSLAAIVLISGDINFAPDLCDLRHRKKIHVILVHNDMCSESLILCANEHYRFSALVASLPYRGAVKSVYQPAELTVTSLPLTLDPNKVRMKLKRLAENCGGRVGQVQGHQATVRFPSLEYAIRAQKRMDGEIVFGCKISVSGPTSVKVLSPVKRRANSKRDDDWTWGDQQETQAWNKMMPHALPGFYRQNAQDSPMPVYNQENVPILPYKSPWTNLIPSQVNLSKMPTRRPILGRRNEPNSHQDMCNGQSSVSGRHSLDSMLDSGGDKPHSQDRRCHTPSPSTGVNTSIPPPPIVNLPRSTDKYVFQPIPVRPKVNCQPSEVSEPLFCQQHSHLSVCSAELPNVTVNLAQFSLNLASLVVAHGNVLPLASLPDCYASQFGPLKTDKLSVHLEHLVTCVADVQLVAKPAGKFLRLQTPTDRSAEVSPNHEDLRRLSVELVELLKAQPRCQVMFDKLIPAYRQHFGRQCRVADYGCTKLVELLNSLSSVIQVMGEGGNRLVTLTHRILIQNFKKNLLRVIRSQASKQLLLRDLPTLWQQTLGRALEPADYGLCYLKDLLDLVPAECVLRSTQGLDVILALPRRTPTPEEREKIKIFAVQMVELLNKMPEQTMEFSQLIPSYHQHFKVQCRLADYGCTKLVDLLDSIPHVLKMSKSEDGVLQVSLVDTQTLLLRTLRILWGQSTGRMSLAEFQHMFYLYYQTRCCRQSLETQLRDTVKITDAEQLELSPLQLFARDVYRLLCGHGGRLPLTAFEGEYQRFLGTAVNPSYYGFPSVSQLLAAVDHVVTVSSCGLSRVMQLNSSLSGVGIPLPSSFTKTETTVNSFPSEASIHPPTAQVLLNGLKVKEDNLPITLTESNRQSSADKLTLRKPEEFLWPSALPSAPHPSTLPPPPTKFIQGSDEDNGGVSSFVDDGDVNDQNKRKLRVAAYFNSPIQLK